MELSEEARERLADVVELQPTKNGELQERWDLESGSDVHQYLESELREYYYRDENSLIRATVEGIELVGGDPAEAERDRTVTVTPLEARIVEVIAGPDDRSESVVSVLTTLREVHGIDPSAGEVRRALQRLKRKGIVTVEYRTVPTFRLAVAREDVDVEIEDADADNGAPAEA